MRTDKELKQIFLNNKDLTHTGLCFWINVLCLKKLITEKERTYLWNKLIDNRPSKSFINKIYNPNKINHSSDAYYWKKGFLAPRIKWLNENLK